MAEIHLDFLNLNLIFTILLILLIGGYLYYEMHKLKQIINEIQYKLNQRGNTIQMGEIESDIPVDHDVPVGLDGLAGSNEIPKIVNNPTHNPTHNPGHRTDMSVDEEISETDNKQNEWSHIHQQMNQEADVESSSSRSSRSSRPSRSSETERVTATNTPPENNSANIDEILSGKNIITDDSLSDILNVDSDLTRIDEFINTIKENESTKIIPTDYDKMTVSQLKKILSDE